MMEYVKPYLSGSCLSEASVPPSEQSVRQTSFADCSDGGTDDD